MFKVYHTNIKTRFEICSQLTIKKPERHQWCCYGFFVVNLSTYFTPCFIVSIINFEHVNVGWAPVPNNQISCLDPENIYLFKVNTRNTRKRLEICSKFTIKIPERLLCHSDVVIVKFEHITHLFLVLLLFTLNKFAEQTILYVQLYSD